MNIIKLQGFEEKEKGIHYEYDADDTPLGEGAMGRVYQGVCINHNTKGRSTVAIKVIYDNIPEAVVERARREAAIRVDSPYLLHMLGFIEQPFSINYNGHVANVMRYFVVMELLEGVTLYDLMQGNTSDAAGNTIPAIKKLHDSYIVDKETTIQNVISKTLRGVKALHNEGYIHRDIDPSNIMITSDGHIKLIDFGICKKINTLGTSDKNLTATGLFMGKVDYASPELIIGDVQHQDKSTDIYALGILLFQLCTGHLPYTGSDNEILLAHMRKKLPLKDLKNSPFKKIVIKATQKSQSARYENADQILDDVESVDFSRQNSMKGVVVSVIVICMIAAGYAIWEFTNNNTKTVSKDIPENSIVEPKLVEDNEDLKKLQGRLWSKDEKEALEAFRELSEMAKKEHDLGAMFEYGLSFCVGNEDFDAPTKRQIILKIDADIERANYWMRRVIEEEPDNYRAVYWLLNNLIVKKEEDSKSVVLDEILDLFEKFDRCTTDQNDNVANKYKESVAKAREKMNGFNN